MARSRPTQSPGGGKKIDTFYYDAQQVVGSTVADDGAKTERVIQKKIALDLWMNKKLDPNPDLPTPASTLDVAFKLVCEETGDAVFGSDISAMLTEMRSKLDLRFHIHWERWFLVRIEPSRVYDAIGTGFTLSWETIERGVAYDGSVLMRRYDKHYGLYGCNWKVSTWPENFMDRGRMIAAIPGTKENELALEQASAQIDDLRKLLIERVGPRFIEETLRALTGGGHLLLGSD